MVSKLKKLFHLGMFVSLFATVTAISTVEQGIAQTSKPIASELVVACAGYISPALPPRDMQIIGGDRESVTTEFAQNDLVYLNKGRNSNIQIGAEYQIIRNIGLVKSPVTPKKTLGSLIYEVGILRIVALQDSSATAEIRTSCNSIYLGDLVIPYEKKNLPSTRLYQPLSLVAPSSNQITGQILAAKFNREQLATNDIVYLNVGVENGVKPGDYLTIYRTLGSDTLIHVRDDRIGPGRSNGFPSNRFCTLDNSSQTSNRESVPKIFKQTPRNTLPRTIVGEIVIIRSEQNTATGVITRTNYEAMIGDKVELQ